MADLIRVSIKGTMPSGELWSVNPVYKITAGTAVTAGQLAAAVTGINAVTIPSPLLLALTSSCAVSGVQLEARTNAGVLEVQAEGLKTTPTPGTGPGALPFQTSVVCSLRTEAGGAHGRGRLYWPATGMETNPATLRITSTVHTAIVAGFVTYLKAIQTALETALAGPASLAVWSRTTNSTGLVTLLRVGDVLDTQRRRRDAVPETYKDGVYIGV